MSTGRRVLVKIKSHTVFEQKNNNNKKTSELQCIDLLQKRT